MCARVGQLVVILGGAESSRISSNTSSSSPPPPGFLPHPATACTGLLTVSSCYKWHPHTPNSFGRSARASHPLPHPSSHPPLTSPSRRRNSSETAPERNIIYLTINAPELDPSYTLSVDGNKLKFEGKSREVASKGTATTLDAKDYALDLELFDEVEEARRGLTGKGVQVVLKKKKAQEEYWPRLLKEKGKNSRIQTDWSKWVDEDEQDEAAAADVSCGRFHFLKLTLADPRLACQDDFGMGGGGMPDMGAMGGMGGMPGMGGMGGMPGMGGMGGGAGGMDFASMMGGGAGGAGGMVSVRAPSSHVRTLTRLARRTLRRCWSRCRRPASAAARRDLAAQRVARTRPTTRE